MRARASCQCMAPCYDESVASFWQRLFGGGENGGAASGGPGTAGDTETVRRIVAELESLPPDRARFVAAFAYVLSRVAYADLEVSSAETGKMEELVREAGGLPPEQAALVIRIAATQARRAGGTENFLVTREFAQIAGDDDKRRLLDSLFAVSAADDSISSAEETQIKQIASELGLSPSAYAEARAAWSHKRAILRDL